MLCSLLAVNSSRAQVAPPNPGSTPTKKAPVPQPVMDQTTNIPYFTLDDGMSSVLTLNNVSPSVTPVQVTIYNLQGKSQALDPITLDPHSFRQIELRDVIVSDEFNSGNIEVKFNGISMGITCQVSVSNLGKRVSFESREQEMMDFNSTKLNGILSLPQASAEGFLAVTNVGQTKVTVQLGIGRKKKTVALYPRESRLLKLREELEEHEPLATLVKLQHDGLPGEIITTGFVLNLEDGYSSSFAMVDPAIMVSSHLAGAHLRLGEPDPSESFPEGTHFRSPLLLANVGSSPAKVHVMLDYTVREKIEMTHWGAKHAEDTTDNFSTVAVKDLTIAPGAVSRVELSEALEKLGLKERISEAGVDIDYDTPPGTLIGNLVSVDQTGDYSFEVPIKDASAMNEVMEGVYPWNLENGNNAVLHIKNTTNKSASGFVLFDYYDSGTVKTYNPDRIILQPYQTLAIDIQELKDSKKKDVRGQMFPADVMRGQVQWHQDEPYSMIGRAEETNVKTGIARSFSCGLACCNYYFQNEFLSPSPIANVVGATGLLGAFDQGTACTNLPFGPYSDTANTWASDSPPIATVASAGTSTGNVGFVTAGSTTGRANANDVYYNYDGCRCLRYNTYYPVQSPIATQPAITGPNTVWYFGGQNPSGYATFITLTSSGGSSTTWTVTAGSTEVKLSATKGAQTTITSSGIAFSSFIGDIGIQATAGGVASPVFSITTRKPYYMAPDTGLYLAGCPDSSQGYLSKVFYTIEDQLFSILPSSVPQNEAWTSSLQNDYPGGSNWIQSQAKGSVVGPVNWFDLIGAYTGTGAVPTVNCSGPHTAVLHWGQQLRFGTTTSNVGQLVQSDTLQKYLNGANHISVVSPK
jgi:hypothetical protein